MCIPTSLAAQRALQGQSKIDLATWRQVFNRMRGSVGHRVLRLLECHFALLSLWQNLGQLPLMNLVLARKDRVSCTRVPFVAFPSQCRNALPHMDPDKL